MIGAVPKSTGSRWVETGRRRRWSEDEKLKIVLESLQAPRQVAVTARRYVGQAGEHVGEPNIIPPSASTSSCPGIGDLRTSLTPNKSGQPSTQDDLTRGRRRTRTVCRSWSGLHEAKAKIVAHGALR